MGVSGDAQTQEGQPAGQVPPDFAGSKQPMVVTMLETSQQICPEAQHAVPQQTLAGAQTPPPGGGVQGVCPHCPPEQNGAFGWQGVSHLPQ